MSSKRSSKANKFDEQEAHVASSDAAFKKNESDEDCKRKQDSSSNEESSVDDSVNMKPSSKVAKSEQVFEQVIGDEDDTPEAFRNVKYDADGASEPQIKYMKTLAVQLKKKLGADVAIDASSVDKASKWIKYAKDKLGKTNY